MDIMTLQRCGYMRKNTIQYLLVVDALLQSRWCCCHNLYNMITIDTWNQYEMMYWHFIWGKIQDGRRVMKHQWYTGTVQWLWHTVPEIHSGTHWVNVVIDIYNLHRIICKCQYTSWSTKIPAVEFSSSSQSAMFLYAYQTIIKPMTHSVRNLRYYIARMCLEQF